MDARGLKAADVAAELHVEEQTVRSWRSQGIPNRRLPHVLRYMEEWKAPVPAADQSTFTDQAVADFVASRQNLVLHPEPEVFNAWTAAFKHSRAETLEQWAIDGLSELAKTTRKSHWGNFTDATAADAPYPEAPGSKGPVKYPSRPSPERTETSEEA